MGSFKKKTRVTGRSRSFFEGLFSNVKILGTVPGRSRDGSEPSRRVRNPPQKLQNLNQIRLGTVPQGFGTLLTLRGLTIENHF